MSRFSFLLLGISSLVAPDLIQDVPRVPEDDFVQLMSIFVLPDGLVLGKNDYLKKKEEEEEGYVSYDHIT